MIRLYDFGSNSWVSNKFVDDDTDDTLHDEYSKHGDVLVVRLAMNWKFSCITAVVLFRNDEDSMSFVKNYLSTNYKPEDYYFGKVISFRDSKF